MNQEKELRAMIKFCKAVFTRKNTKADKDKPERRNTPRGTDHR